MGILSNARHERFAQALAAGKTQSEAYVEAGYTPSEPNASRLTSNDKVQARVAELQGRAAEGVVLSRQWVIERLIKNVEKSEAQDNGGAVVNRALELLGKEIGMFVERIEQDQNVRVITDKPVTDAEWEERYVDPVGAAGGAAESTH